MHNCHGFENFNDGKICYHNPVNLKNFLRHKAINGGLRGPWTGGSDHLQTINLHFLKLYDQ